MFMLFWQIHRTDRQKSARSESDFCGSYINTLLMIHFFLLAKFLWNATALWSVELTIQWLIKIQSHLISSWRNQCVWTNQLNNWFKWHHQKKQKKVTEIHYAQNGWKLATVSGHFVDAVCCQCKQSLKPEIQMALN